MLQRKAPVDKDTCSTCSRHSDARSIAAVFVPFANVASLTKRFISASVKSSNCDAAGSWGNAATVCRMARCRRDQISGCFVAFYVTLWTSSLVNACMHQLTSPGSGVWVLGFVGDVHSAPWLPNCVDVVRRCRVTRHNSGSASNQSETTDSSASGSWQSTHIQISIKRMLLQNLVIKCSENVPLWA